MIAKTPPEPAAEEEARPGEEASVEIQPEPGMLVSEAVPDNLPRVEAVVADETGQQDGTSGEDAVAEEGSVPGEPMGPPTEEPLPDTTEVQLNEAEPGFIMIPETPIVVPEEVVLADEDVLSGGTEPLDAGPAVVASKGGPGLREGTGGNPEERGELEVTSTLVRGDQGTRSA